MSSHNRCLLLIGLPFAVAAAEEPAGRGQIFWQSYQLGGSTYSQSLLSGLGAHIRYDSATSGIFTAHSEGYRGTGSTRLGTNYLQWDVPQWRARRWSVRAGDFEVDSSVLDRPFFNVYYPSIIATGVRVEASTRNTMYRVFAGQGLIYDGPRISVRAPVPQSVFGAAMRMRIFPKLQIGIRMLHLSNDLPKLRGSGLESNALALRRSTSIGGQLLYTPVVNLKLFAELTQSLPVPESGAAPGAAYSYLVGMSYLTSRITARFNFVDKSETELPLLQVRTWGRRGPFAEFAVRPFSALEFFAAGSLYHSATDLQSGGGAMRSLLWSAGFHSRLPLRFDLSGTITAIQASSVVYNSRQRQLGVVLSRPIGRSTLRAWGRELNLMDGPLPSRQRSLELENTYAWRRFIAGGAIRLQSNGAPVRRTTAFGRANVQVRLKSITIFQNMEYGRDLSSTTFFAANRFQTATAGLNWRLLTNWLVEGEVFRNQLASYGNLLQDFVLSGTGIEQPLPVRISGSNQWAVFARVSRSFGFGPPVTQDRAARIDSKEGAGELTGTVEGYVREASSGERSDYVAGIAVQLDDDRVARTDGDGRYRFPGVSEGIHSAALAQRELPAEYDGAMPDSQVVVRAGRPTRLDFEVHPLGSLNGEVKSERDEPIIGVTIRLNPSGRSTVTGDDGQFEFHNLRQGAYEIQLDRETLPPRHVPVSGDHGTRTVTAKVKAPAVLFRIRIVPEPPKPIRVIPLARNR